MCRNAQEGELTARLSSVIICKTWIGFNEGWVKLKWVGCPDPGHFHYLGQQGGSGFQLQSRGGGSNQELCSPTLVQ